MSRQTYNEQVITQYLLGSLPEDQAVSFDELSFTDDEFANTLKVVENDLVDSYVRSELSGQTLERFESIYLASTLRRKKIKFAQAFQVFAEKAAAQQVTGSRDPASKSQKTVSGLLSALNVFRAPRLGLQWGVAAAALIFLVAGGWVVFENIRLRQQMSQTQARRNLLLQREQELQEELEGQRLAKAKTEQELARVGEERQRLEQELKNQQGPDQQQVAKKQPASPGEHSIAFVILAPPVRGVGKIPTVSIWGKTDLVSMQLELEATNYPGYHVALIDQANNQTLWQSGRLRLRATREGKALSIRFSASLLKPQNYVLQVSGISANGASEIVGDYPFKVTEARP